MTNYEIWIGFVTLTRRELRRFLRIWVQTLVPSVITAALYFLIFGELIGSRIGPVNNISYAEFVAPGLIMLAAITNSYTNTVSSFFGSKFQRQIEEILVSPMPPIIILLGFMIGGMVRGMIVGLMVWLMSIVFVGFNAHSMGVIFITLLMTTALFSLFGLMNAVYAITFDDITIIPTFILTPLIYLGGVFYSTSMLSPLWHNIALFNPVLYMVNAFRYGMLGISDVSLSFTYMMCVLFITVSFLFNLHLLKNSKRLRN